MSGWIKLEKDLREDPRFLRIVAKLRARELSAVTDVTQVRCIDRKCVTQVLGCLAQLWMYADSYIRDDDTLDLGAHEIDEFVGVDGFCDMMPEDWLEIVDEHRVKLPYFHDHNGTEAKKKALTAKRVARHRIRNVTQERSSDDPSCNDDALPDLDLDQTKTRPEKSKNARDDVSHETSNDEAAEHVAMLKAKWPRGAARENWIGAERAARRLVDDGLVTWDEIHAGVERYARLAKATGRVVMNPVNFFTAEDRPWSQLWPLPATKAEAAQSANVDAALTWLEQNHAAN